MRPGLLFALFRQLHQLGEFVVHHVDECRFLLVECSNKVGVAGDELRVGDKVWILHLKGDVKATVTLSGRAFVVASQDFCSLLRAVSVDVLHLDTLAILHLLHLQRQFHALQFVVLISDDFTGFHLLEVSTRTGHLDLDLAWLIGTCADVTGSVAAVVAFCSFDCAKLLTDIGRRFAFVLVALLDALVAPTLQAFSASHSTAERILVAWDSLTLLVLTVAQLGRKEDTRRTVVFAVAKMIDWMSTFVASRALVGALWNSGAAGNRWIDNGAAALTSHFIEGHAVARRTVTDVAGTLASVLLAFQHPTALLCADVLWIDATVLIAAMLPACSKLHALLLASHIGTQQVFASDFLLDAATATLHVCRLCAWRTLSQMTRSQADVRRGQRTASKRLGAL